MTGNKESDDNNGKGSNLEEKLSTMAGTMMELQTMMKHLMSMNYHERRRNREEPDEEEEPIRPEPKQKDDDRGLKLDVPEFEGELDGEKFMDWIRQAERVFDYKGYDEHRKFKIATLKLTKYASLWYENLKKQRKREDKSKIDTWEKLKKHLKKRFMPRDYEQEQYLNLTSLTQGNRSVSEYIKEFEKLAIVCDLEEKEELKMARFIRGLNPQLAQKVEVQTYLNFDDVCRLSLKFEKQEKGKRRAFTRDHLTDFTAGDSDVSSSNLREILKEEPKDKEKGIPNLDPKSTRFKRCYKCQGYGHIANECTQKRALTLRELKSITPCFVQEENHETVERSLLSCESKSGEIMQDHIVEPLSSSDEDEEAVRKVQGKRNLMLQALPIMVEEKVNYDALPMGKSKQFVSPVDAYIEDSLSRKEGLNSKLANDDFVQELFRSGRYNNTSSINMAKTEQHFEDGSLRECLIILKVLLMLSSINFSCKFVKLVFDPGGLTYSQELGQFFSKKGSMMREHQACN